MLSQTLGSMRHTTTTPTTTNQAKPHRTLSDFHYELMRLNHKLNKPDINECPQNQYNAILSEIDKLTKELDVFNQQLEKKIQFMGLSQRSWSWIRDGVCAVGVLAGIATLVSSVVTGSFGSSNSTQTTATVTTGIISSAWSLCYGIIAGAYWLVENRKNEAMAAQTEHLNESRHISEFWKHFNDIRDLTRLHKNTEMNRDDVTVTISDDATVKIDNQSKKSFAKCVECIQEIKKTNDTATPERLGSMLAQTQPNLKELLDQQQLIHDQIKELLEAETPISKGITVKNESESNSSNDNEVFLKTIKATSEHLKSSDDTVKTIKEECQQKLQKNFNTLSYTLGINIARIYINPGDDVRPILLFDSSFHPNEQSKI